MKHLLVLSLCFGFLTSVYTQTLKPYTIGAESTSDLTSVKSEVVSRLSENGFTILGQYKPAKNKKRELIVITSNELKQAVKKVGGLSGFAAALRVGITQEGSKVIISYTTPQYWGRAYFQDNYVQVEELFETFADKLSRTFLSLGERSGEQFGSEKGLKTDKLQSYKYMLGMPKFNDNIELNAFESYSEAVSKIDGNFSMGVKDLELVYSIEFKDLKMKLYGVGLGGETGESSFLPTIDIDSPKHTAFLPYEMLVLENKVYMLHGRYRIALSFPDLTMGTFMKIVSTPKNIIRLLEKATQ
jgi:uncharacterized protein (DUF302 family)